MTSGTDTNFQASLRARVGFGIDRVMVYGTGGLALANVENVYKAELPAGNVFGAPVWASSSKFDELRWGWTIGTGAEYALCGRSARWRSLCIGPQGPRELCSSKHERSVRPVANAKQTQQA